MLSEQQGQHGQFCVAEREPKQRTKFACPSSICTLAALLKASCVHGSVQDETTISSPSGFSTNKLGSGKINCLRLPHTRAEETAALCFHFLRPPWVPLDICTRKDSCSCSDYFLWPVSVAHFTSASNLTKANKAGLEDSMLHWRNSFGNGKIL